MKNIFKFCFLFFAMTAVITSCNNDDDDSDPNNPNTNQSGISLVSPQNNAEYTASNGGVTVDFDWSDVSGATGYTFQLSESNSFSTTVEEETITVSQYSTSVANSSSSAKTYYWRVKVANQSEWSSVFALVVNPENVNNGGSGIISLVSPADSTMYETPGGTSVDVTFEWEDTSGDDKEYMLRVSKWPSFAVPTDYSPSNGTLNHTVTLYNSSTTNDRFYYWKVGTYPVGGDPENVVWEDERRVVIVNVDETSGGGGTGGSTGDFSGSYSGDFSFASHSVTDGNYKPMRIEGMVFTEHVGSSTGFHSGTGTLVLMDTMGVEHSGYIYMEGNYESSTNKYFYRFNSLQTPDHACFYGNDVQIADEYLQFNSTLTASDPHNFWIDEGDGSDAYWIFNGFTQD